MTRSFFDTRPSLEAPKKLYLRDGERVYLYRSEDLYVLRLHEGHPFELLSRCVDPGLCDDSHIVDHFPESRVWVYRMDQSCGFSIDELKQRLRAKACPQLEFIGSLWIDAKSGRYQIYTGNLFLRFDATWSSAQCEAALLRWGLSLKRRLGFGQNCYFVEPQKKTHFDVFDWASNLNRRREVQSCQPELVIARRSLGGVEIPRTFVEDVNRHWVHEKVCLKKAWKLSRGRGAKICIIDDGIDPEHPAFRGEQSLTEEPEEVVSSSLEPKIAGCIDVLDASNTRAEHRFSSEMHGTACASVAASADRRALGAAPQAQLLIARSKGLGSVLEAEAIYWAVQAGADVISCSWGPSDGDIDDPLDDYPSLGLPSHTKMAIEYATTHGRQGKGCLVVFAAGNGNEAVALDAYASHPGVIAVGSVNREDRKTRYSDYGAPMFCVYPSSELRKTPYGYALDYGVTVADRLGRPGLSDGDYCALFGGTSASAPGVAGVAAIALSLNPELSLPQLKTLLANSCDKIGPAALYDSDGYSQVFGHGRLNAQKVAHQALKSRREPPEELQPRLKPDPKKDPQPADSTEETPMSSKAKGYALHIGIDRSDPAVFEEFPTLQGCVNDARALAAIFDKRGYDTQILSDQSATRQRVLAEIESLVHCAQAGDWVVISYAGHGSWVPDETGDEAYDEVLVCYDGFLIDDELYDLFCEFQEGVRLVWIADCCHAESNHRMVKTKRAETGRTRHVRELRPSVIRKVYEAQRDDYISVQLSLSRMGRRQAQASVLGLFACQDDQTAKEIDGRGVFTRRIETLYYKDSPLWYRPFVEELCQLLGNQQDPKVEFYGKNHHFFEDTPLFELAWDPKPMPLPRPPPAPEPAPASPGSKLLSDRPQASEIALLVHGEREKLRLRAATAPAEERRVRVVDQELQAQVSSAQNPWDRAYDTVKAARDLDGLDFIEPDIVSDLYRFPPSPAGRGSSPSPKPSPRSSPSEFKASRSNPQSFGGNSHGGAYLSSYPNPEHPNYHFIDHPFVWQLDDAYSQLRGAFDQIRKEVAVPPKNLQEAQKLGLPLICHIDTGVLLNHPTLPRFFDAKRSRSFSGVGSKKDISDHIKEGAWVENQGHGHGTISILAGDYVNLEDTYGEYRGYFGAFPYARVMSLKISENVVLLSGRKFARALRYAIEQGADVVTLSMAGAPSRVMLKAINEAYEAGVVVVAAAGNSWVKGGKRLLPKKTMYPARFRRVIGVTGVTLDHTPYRVEDNKNWRRRAVGGEYMQSCYGPRSANRSNIAAYTPNIRWAGHFAEGALFERSGGGTSSATPQVAAAAAMWLFVHRKQLPKKDWRRAEMVRQALFRSADKSRNQKYGLYFGQGMLKAEKALAITPRSLRKVKKAKADSLGWFVFPRIVGQFFGRSAGDAAHAVSGSESQRRRDEILREMLSAELAQLCLRDPKLFRFDSRRRLQSALELNQDLGPGAGLDPRAGLDPGVEPGLVSGEKPRLAAKSPVHDEEASARAELAALVKAVYQSPLASDFLKQQLAALASIAMPNPSSREDSEAEPVYRSYRIRHRQKVLGRVAAYQSGVRVAEAVTEALDYGYCQYDLEFVADPKARGRRGFFEFFALDEAWSGVALAMERREGLLPHWRWILPPATSRREGERSAGRSSFGAGACQIEVGSWSRERGLDTSVKKWSLRVYGGSTGDTPSQSARLSDPLADPLSVSQAGVDPEPRLEGLSSLRGLSGLFLGQMTPEGLRWRRLDEPSLAALKEQGRALLLISGLFCGVEMTFSGLWQEPARFAALSGEAGDLFLVYQSQALGVRGIRQESEALQQALQALYDKVPQEEFEIRVLAHGRGALIARFAFEASTLMALVAGPLRGSAIYRSSFATDLLHRVTNLWASWPLTPSLEASLSELSRWAQQLSLRGPALEGAHPVARGEAELESSPVAKIDEKMGPIGQMEQVGQADQADEMGTSPAPPTVEPFLSPLAYSHELVPGSALLEDLAREHPLSQRQLLVASHLEPTAELLRRWGDVAVDLQAFGTQANDGVVPVASALARGEGLGPTKVYLDPLGRNHFFSYFDDAMVIEAIARHFHEQPQA